MSEHPPGPAATPAEDIDIYSPAFLADPPAAFAKLRCERPVARSNQHGGFWLLSRYEDVRAAAINWRDFTSSVVGVTAIPVISRRTIAQLPIEIDPPQHSRYRALINPVFSPIRVEQIRPRIEQIVRSRLKALIGVGPVDLVAELCAPVAIGSLVAFTDMPGEDSHLWLGWILRMFNPQNREDGAAASAEMASYIDALIAERRKTWRGDFIGMLMEADIDGERLDDQAIRSFVQVMFGAGFETTADGMSIMLHWLAENPAGLARLRREPILIESAVEEFLRFGSPIQVFGRNATHDLDLAERTIRSGEIVALGFGAANRDPSVFENPDEVKLDRRPNRHLAFGAGPHLCAGAGVARMEMTLLLEALVETELELRLDQEAKPEWKKRGDRRGLAKLPAILRQTSNEASS